MYTSFEIANYFIRKSLKTGVELTPMKLIKLTYISHGWHLGLYSKELLDERICAWKYGPVIQSLYHEFKQYGNSAIREFYRIDNCEDCYPMPDISIHSFLDKIWDVYGLYDGIQLSAMTHQTNTPWDIVWNQRGGCNRASATIPNDIIEKHYKDKINNVNQRPKQEAALN